MGMDVVGNSPSKPEGEYFRSSIWAWHSIVSVLEHTCSDFMPQSFFEDISVNCGFGADGASSKKMSVRVIQYLEHNVNGKSLPSDEAAPVAKAMKELVKNIEQTSGSSSDLPSDFYATDGKLSEFAGFLQNCGGFSVH
tara:strand:+ start:1231 stop:1644 length:414 start_codon:yes stop_codon:yes gene_type:complete